MNVDFAEEGPTGSESSREVGHFSVTVAKWNAERKDRWPRVESYEGSGKG